MPPLTEIKIKSLAVQDKAYRVWDEKGLYLEVSPAGGKLWRFKYRFVGKEKRLSLGQWPEVKLAEARGLRDEARQLLRQGQDPALTKRRGNAANDNTFAAISREWLKSREKSLTERHLGYVRRRLEQNVYPFLGNTPIDLIAPNDILQIARRIEDRGSLELSKRVLNSCSQIFRYAVATGRIPSDPCRDLKGALSSTQKKNFAALTSSDTVGGLMRAIDGYQGSIIVQNAMKLSALTFCRPGEIRHAEWSEIDWEAKEWRIPAAKMKMRREHRVPLSHQALAVLGQLQPVSGTGKYVFPGARRNGRPMSENGVLAALRSMGYTSEQMTPHGFRAMASTLLNELGERPDVIEAQLAHKEADKVRAAYNRAQYMQERREMMQRWADYLDELKGKI